MHINEVLTLNRKRIFIRNNSKAFESFRKYASARKKAENLKLHHSDISL